METNKPGDIKEFVINKEKREVKTFKSVPSRYFEMRLSWKDLHDLMYFMQQEGILAQNSFSESAPPDVDRDFFLWVNNDDAETIDTWLKEKSCTPR